MANSTIPLNPGTGGRTLDSEQLTVGAVAVQRQRGQIAGSGATEVAAVRNTNPTGSEYGLFVRVVGELRAGSSTVAKVPASATNVLLLAANAARLSGIVFNDSVDVLLLKLGSAAGADDFTARIFGNGYYEIPFQWTGPINGLWLVATGSARVTEFTA